MPHLELAAHARVHEETHVLERSGERKHVAGAEVVVVLKRLDRGPRCRAEEDLRALERERAGHLGVRFVEADHEADLAEAGVEHGVVARARVEHDALRERLVHLAVLAHEPLRPHDDERVVEGVEALVALLRHAPPDVDVELLRHFDEVLRAVALWDELRDVMLVFRVVGIEDEHWVLRHSPERELREEDEVGVLRRRLLDVGVHLRAVRRLVVDEVHRDACEYCHSALLVA